MLPIKVPDWDEWDEKSEMFVRHKGPLLKLEHSLISISRWEAITHKPFLNNKDRTDQDMLIYIRCMAMEKEPSYEELMHLRADDFERIGKYIDDSQTATWFREEPGRKSPSRRIITSELIYYWMIKAGVPFECQKWHINRLMTLIRVVNEEEKPKKKMPRKAMLAQRAKLNAERRARLGTTG